MDVIEVDRFDQVVMKSSRCRALAIRVLSVTGDGDQVDPFEAGYFTQAPGEFVAVHHGETDIEKRNRRPGGGGHVNRLGTIVSDPGMVPIQTQRIRQHLGGIGVVVHDQHADAGGRLRRQC